MIWCRKESQFQSIPGHDHFEFLGIDEAVPVAIKDLESLANLGSLKKPKKRNV
jgi:hypothetical protein